MGCGVPGGVSGLVADLSMAVLLSLASLPEGTPRGSLLDLRHAGIAGAIKGLKSGHARTKGRFAHMCPSRRQDQRLWDEVAVALTVSAWARRQERGLGHAARRQQGQREQPGWEAAPEPPA